MGIFDVLAVIGAVTGPPAAIAQIWSVWRDRPKIKLDFGVRTAIGQPPQLWLGIRNDGRQPITVRSAGFYGSEMPAEINSQEHGKLQATVAYSFALLKTPLLLDPGRYHELQGGVPDAVEYGYHVDFPLRAYVDDARGNRVWGPAAPITRMLVGGGDCPPNFPDYLWEKTDEPLRPARVEPSWKLWVRRELRRGGRGRPSADELRQLTGHSGPDSA